MYTNFGIISATICHNPPGEGSRKLYYYTNSNLFQCYTGGCEKSNFDIFELTIKVFSIQNKKDIDLNEAVRWIAGHFGLSGSLVEDFDEKLADWDYLTAYEKLQDIELSTNKLELKEYDDDILSRFNYEVKIQPWLDENINEEVMKKAKIGYYAGNNQITIPHFNKDNKLVGIRGRALSEEDAEMYGKYRPLKINGIWYNHPLGLNLYGLNWAKESIATFQKAIIYESEKSVLKSMSYFGDNNISIACCGSSLSPYQISMLLDLGVQEIVIGFDKQYENLTTPECKQWIKRLTSFHEKYKANVKMSFMFDKGELIGYKSSPIDEGVDKFLKLFEERITL